MSRLKTPSAGGEKNWRREDREWKPGANRSQPELTGAKNFPRPPPGFWYTLAKIVKDPKELSHAALFAADALGKIGSPAAPALPSLQEVLDQPETESGGFEDASVRVRAAEAIGQIGITQPAVATRMETALSDSNPYVRAKSAQAMLRNGITSPEAITVLGRLMSDDDVAVRRFTMDILRHTHRLSHLMKSQLQKALTDSDPEVRQGAQELLGGLHP